MNLATKLGGGVVAASAACCAVSVVPALLAGAGIAALGGAAVVWGGVSLLAAASLAAGLYFAVRGKPVQPSGGCGCWSPTDGDAAIACTLGAGEFKTRTEEIRELARRSLRSAERRPLALTLIYAAGAYDDVTALIAREKECCPFLGFSVQEKADAIEVTIVAPESAAEAADTLFVHFAPELATSTAKETA